MPNVGDEEFAYTPQGIQAAKQKSAATGIPISNAAERSVVNHAGTGQANFNSIGQQPMNPMQQPMYKDGGKVKYEEGGKVSKESNVESGATYPKSGEEGYWDYEIQPQIDREKKRKDEAKAKKDKQAKDKAIKARDKKDKEKGAKKYGPHWGASDDMPGGSGRE